jgi:hypothetical protein
MPESNPNLRRALARVALFAGLSLFAELFLIRWLDSQVRVLGFTRNVPLLAAFLGLGIGYARASMPGRRRLAPFAAPAFALGILLGIIPDLPAGGVAVFGPTTIESNTGVFAATSSLEVLALFAAVAAVFAGVVLSMVPFGELAGEAIRGLDTLQAYSTNLAGSIVGVALTFALAAMGAPLWVNAALVLLMVAIVLPARAHRAIAIGLLFACAASMIALDHRGEVQRFWSPYNRVDLSPAVRPAGLRSRDRRVEPTREWTISVQSIFFQRMLDFDTEFGSLDVYHAPYRERARRSVLVLGAGSGNDVEAAIRGGAERVDAVEIDPLIERLGRKYHPQHPYSDPRVRAIVDDARAYLRRPGPNYDLIVFGILDAHLSFFSSFASSIRLDNYVYTVESMRAARSRLNPGGEVWATVYIDQPWVVENLRAAMKEAIGAEPRVSYAGGDGATFVFAAAEAGAKQGSTSRRVFSGWLSGAAVPTDDWPYPYLKRRALPAPTVGAALGMLLATAALLRLVLGRSVRFHRGMFLLGAGFLLVETRVIAQLALLFGTTWRVSGIAILGILTIAWLASLAARRWPALSDPWLYAGLLASLVIGWLVPVGRALGGGELALVGATALLVLPVGFSSIIFARKAVRIANLSEAMASNLAGGVLGGAMENLSLVLGISALALIAALLYAVSFESADR